MNMPGFTAEASVYKTSKHYRASVSVLSTSVPEIIVPVYYPSPKTRSDCNTCLEDCVTGSIECDAAAAAILAGCIFPPLCPGAVAAAGAALLGCQTAFLTCAGICDATKCCPKLCGTPNPFDPGSGCCDSGETCVDQNDPNSRNGCCPSGQSVCDGKCCPSGETCCGDACCPTSSGYTCQQGVCCPPGYSTVCNGECCPGVCDQNGNCCEDPNRLCGGECCRLGERCLPTLGVCCLEDKICGSVCCGTNQFCQDPANGVCGACPPGQHPCSIVGEPLCCPDGSDCCKNGQCCPPDTCCFDDTCYPKGDRRCTPR